MAGPPELDTHQCLRVHHGDPYTKLGPFKVEVVHHNPVFYILHELFTEEDMEHLISWAKPRLSSKREIRLAEDTGVHGCLQGGQTMDTSQLHHRLV